MEKIPFPKISLLMDMYGQGGFGKKGLLKKMIGGGA